MVLLASAEAWANDYCFSTKDGKRVYCDSGTKYYKYGKTIQRIDPDGTSHTFRRFDKTIYGEGANTWARQHKDGTRSLQGFKGKDNIIVPNLGFGTTGDALSESDNDGE